MTQKRFPTVIMSTVCVPWGERGQDIESMLRKNVRQALAGTRHLYLFGTAGFLVGWVGRVFRWLGFDDVLRKVAPIPRQ